MPKDNHSVMQLYIDGFKRNFYSFFFMGDKNSNVVNFKNLPKEGREYWDDKVRQSKEENEKKGKIVILQKYLLT